MEPKSDKIPSALTVDSQRLDEAVRPLAVLYCQLEVNLETRRLSRKGDTKDSLKNLKRAKVWENYSREDKKKLQYTKAVRQTAGRSHN